MPIRTTGRDQCQVDGNKSTSNGLKERQHTYFGYVVGGGNTVSLRCPQIPRIFPDLNIKFLQYTFPTLNNSLGHSEIYLSWNTIRARWGNPPLLHNESGMG